jgi:non-ribosomal peptide synthetase component F
VLRQWNATELVFPREQTIHGLFEQQAALTPDSTAILDGSESLTYLRLNQKANRIAHTLLAKGVQVEDIVGIFMSHTSDLVAAMLGVLKAGAAYLPLDQRTPPARIHAMLADSRCRIVLSDHSVPLNCPGAEVTRTQPFRSPRAISPT